MTKLLLAAAAAIALASPASAQFFNQTHISGTSMPLGGGFQSYNYNVGGQMHGGMSMPLGGGFQSYNGW